MPHELDITDRKILALLQQDGRMTNKEVGEKLHKTPTPIHERIKRMEKDGIIKGYTAVLDHKKIDRGLMAFTHVTVQDHSHDSLILFEAAMVEFEEVLECYHMSGNYDFILRVAVKDLDTYHNFLMNKLFKTMPLNHILSTFVMREAKAEVRYSLDLPHEKK